MDGMYKREEGYTLIIVLWAIVILSLIFVNLIDKTHIENVLILNNKKNIKNYETILSAVNLGINQLKKDTTIYDSKKDNWYKPLEGRLDGFNYTVLIRDSGSKLNINYTQKKILSKLSWWNKELKNNIGNSLVPDLLYIKGLLGANYNNAKNVITTYSKYNINSDSINGMKNLLYFVGTPGGQVNVIVDSLEKYRKKEKRIKSINQIPAAVKGLDLSTLEKLRPYITVKGQININLVSENVLTAILRGLRMNQNQGEDIINYRGIYVIKEISQLEEILSEENFKKIAPFLTTTSRIFTMKVIVSDDEGAHSEEVNLVLERSSSGKGNWNIKIIKWQE